ncbi:acetyl-CoA synthetase-like protein [Periconia macrospinosa]|uniref:Acetyl-CoA synthetase-like protein n=1 Tax=Periconia macrospinosa TaxID=97972 RepID=A0A2V1CX23_9PLEO|nr:acetyl-CoA synthetase-like protein [Periconia macrospinosa]
MSHKACATNFQSRLSLLQSYTSTTRVLQFSSFAFDVSVFDIFGTLSAGGCIVIPHESYRINPSRLSRFMTDTRVNWASLSPTFVEFLNPADVPTLETLILGGELLTKEIIMRWKRLDPARMNVRLGNELGPSETCVACVGNYDVGFETDPRDLGRPVGGNKLFLVDKDNSSKLVPVGCIGELVVYGESVMDGYFDDIMKTEESFVYLPEECRAWLPKAEHKKAFRTGDLFFLNEKGHLMYVGRKDRQLKLRGFRMEAGEIEECIKLERGVKGAVAELMTMQDEDGEVDNADNRQELVAFFSFKDTPSLTEKYDGCELSACEASIISPSSNPLIPILIRRIKSRVRDALPHYMAPSLYVPISHIPMTRSGKQDRNQLRSLLNRAALQLFQELHGFSHIDSSSAERGDGSHTTADEILLSPIEHELKALWAKVLGFSRKGDIGHDSDFFHLGGNSIKAIQLSALADKTGLGNLDVVGIYESPTLREMAALCSITAETDFLKGRPWDNMEDGILDGMSPIRRSGRLGLMNENNTNDPRKQRICTTLGLDLSDVEDVYPCTPLQEGLFAISIRQPGTYIVARVWRLGCQIDINAFRDAWGFAIQKNEILRTRIAEDEQRFWQVVVAHSRMGGMRQMIEEREIRELDLSVENKESVRRLDCDESQGSQGSRGLSFFEILNDKTTGERYFKWTIHHAVYDACVLSMVWAQPYKNDLESASPTSSDQPTHPIFHHIASLSGKHTSRLPNPGRHSPPFQKPSTPFPRQTVSSPDISTSIFTLYQA